MIARKQAGCHASPLYLYLPLAPKCITVHISGRVFACVCPALFPLPRAPPRRVTAGCPGRCQARLLVSPRPRATTSERGASPPGEERLVFLSQDVPAPGEVSPASCQPPLRLSVLHSPFINSSCLFHEVFLFFLSVSVNLSYISLLGLSLLLSLPISSYFHLCSPKFRFLFCFLQIPSFSFLFSLIFLSVLFFIRPFAHSLYSLLFSPFFHFLLTCCPSPLQVISLFPYFSPSSSSSLPALPFSPFSPL